MAHNHGSAMSQSHITMAENGRLIIPAGMRAEIGLPEGGKMVARVENGTVILEPFEDAVRRARDLVRRYVPQGISLTDELVAERHAATERE
ncbi:AbrB/MazE/SpoVT family DNA-binding domain-containing protein [Azospirillaceae bacterium]